MDYSMDLTKARWIEKKGLVMKILDKNHTRQDRYGPRDSRSFMPPIVQWTGPT